MIHLTVPGVLGHMREAVAAQGADHVYQPPDPDDDWTRLCRYVWHGCPSCLIGVVLHLAGVPLVEMERWDPCPVESLLARLARDGVVSYDVHVREVLVVAQEAQDVGCTWGMALADTERLAAELAWVTP